MPSYPSTPLASHDSGSYTESRHDTGLDVGDIVDVPGGMYGTVRFIGTVRGKKGSFAGVELSREWSSRGKNDGEVDG
jgi:hypothetical protein